MLGIPSARGVRDQQDGLIAAIFIGREDAILAWFGVIRTNVSNAFSVGRESQVAIHVVGHKLWIATQHRGAVEIELRMLVVGGLLEVDIISVGRKGQVAVERRRGWNRLGIAARWYVAQPQALHPIVILHVKNIFPVWRNRRQQGFARIRNLRDGEILEGYGPERLKKEYKPKPAAATSARTTTIATVVPTRCSRATAVTLALLPAAGDAACDAATRRPLADVARARPDTAALESRPRGRFRSGWPSSRTAVALQAFQVAAHLGSVLIAQVAIFFEGFVDDLFQPRRDVGIEADDWDRCRGSESLRR